MPRVKIRTHPLSFDLSRIIFFFKKALHMEQNVHLNRDPSHTPHKLKTTSRMFSSSSSSSSPSNTDTEQDQQTVTLISGLPNDLSSQILSCIPYSHHSRLKPTSKSWKSFLSSKTLISLRQTHNQSHLLCIFPQDPSISSPYLFDPISLAWRPLPPMPCNPYTYGLSNFISISYNHHLYVLGGSLFDARSFPIDRPSPSSSIYRFDLISWTWDRLSSMISPRGSFACAVDENSGQILVAGGGSRHSLFAAAGSRMDSVEKYDVHRDEWVALDGLPRFRAGCVGFLVKDGEEMEFWVMGGYGEARTVSGILPVDEYYKNGVVLELKNGGKWREIGDMWEEGERRRLGNVVAVDGENGEVPGIFMLEGANIFRYDIACNRWLKESSVPRQGTMDTSFGFAALNGELYVLSHLKAVNSVKSQCPREYKSRPRLLIQVYHPKKKAWRYLTTRPPFNSALDFKTAVMCTVRI